MMVGQRRVKAGGKGEESRHWSHRAVVQAEADCRAQQLLIKQLAASKACTLPRVLYGMPVCPKFWAGRMRLAGGADAAALEQLLNNKLTQLGAASQQGLHVLSGEGDLEDLAPSARLPYADRPLHLQHRRLL